MMPYDANNQWYDDGSMTAPVNNDYGNPGSNMTGGRQPVESTYDQNGNLVFSGMDYTSARNQVPQQTQMPLYSTPNDPSSLKKTYDQLWLQQAQDEARANMPQARSSGLPGYQSGPSMTSVMQFPPSPAQRLTGIANSAAGATNNASAPTYFLQRLKDLVSNPGSITSSPGYQFMFDQGMNALNRTAGAKRMRFAGKTQLDAEKFGQGLASTQYLQLVLQALAQATDERNRWTQESIVGLDDMKYNSGRYDTQQSEAGYGAAIPYQQRLIDKYVPA